MGEMKERMLRGDLYIARDRELGADHARAQQLLEAYNATTHADQSRRDEILAELLGEIGDGVVVKPPFRCDYGRQIAVGAGTFVNYGCVMLDVAPIALGEACQIGPAVQFLAADHPIDPEARRRGWESARPITVGDNVWIGGGAIVCPGVTIGDDAVIGAGSVVTRDVRPAVVAYGVPAKERRAISDADRVETPE
jgi:maltose O-acetyltransferase